MPTSSCIFLFLYFRLVPELPSFDSEKEKTDESSEESRSPPPAIMSVLDTASTAVQLIMGDVLVSILSLPLPLVPPSSPGHHVSARYCVCCCTTYGRCPGDRVFPRIQKVPVQITCNQGT